MKYTREEKIAIFIYILQSIAKVLFFALVLVVLLSSVVFADNETKDSYLEDPTQTELILGTFDAPFNYTASISMITDTYVAILTGTTGNVIRFTFDVVNK